MTAVELFEAARRRLAGCDREHLGARHAPRRMLGIARAPRIVPAGSAWHIGVLLISDDAVYETGDILRAREEVRRGFTAESQRERAELAAAAFRGGFPEGATVHVGWRMLDAAAVDRGEASGPLALVAGVPSLRWRAGADHVPLAGYLDDRISLLLAPPSGA